MTGAAYYLVIPFYFNIKEFASTLTNDARYLAFGEVLYDIIGIFPLLFLGMIFLNAYQQSVRQSSGEIGFD